MHGLVMVGVSVSAFTSTPLSDDDACHPLSSLGPTHCKTRGIQTREQVGRLRLKTLLSLNRATIFWFLIQIADGRNCMMGRRRERNLSQYLMWLASAVLCSLSAVVSFCGHRLKPTDIQCVRNRSSWSPATNAIEYHWETWEDFDFFTKSGYFQRKPSEEVDQAWDALLPSE